MTIKEINKVIKGVFKLPKRKWYFGVQRYGCPYFFPMHYMASIFRVRKLKLRTDAEYKEYCERWTYTKHRPEALYKNLPMVRRSWNKILYSTFLDQCFYVEWGWPIALHRGHLGWKDKYSTPRFEWAPSFHIFFFGLQLCCWWVPPGKDLDNYWEQVLWYIHYSDKDINKARETWGWQDMDGNSTWNDNYLI